MFKQIDFPLWVLTRHNPILLLRRIDHERLERHAEDPDFLKLYDRVLERCRSERTDEGTWYAAQHPELRERVIAYFCAEFGLHNTVPIYSGGLGVLAGDHCKAASDLGLPMIAVGLFYTRGYFDQTLRLDGWQEDADETFDLSTMPLVRLRGAEGEPALTWVWSSGRKIHVGVWRMDVGRVPVYLLDSDLEENEPEDRELSHKLYQGGVDRRLRQEGLLGIGGVRVLRALGIEPVIWHANEGHASFMMVERVRSLTAAGTPIVDAVREVRATSMFTTHTPVPAGHDIFTHDQIAEWAGPYWDKIGDREELLGLGQAPGLDDDRFHMTAAAIRLSSRVNAVSERHGIVTRDIWRELWPNLEVDDIPIDHVTNGVHRATWMNDEIIALLDLHLGGDWAERLHDPHLLDGILTMPDSDLWITHTRLKTRLIDFIREEARRKWREKWQEASHLVGAGTLLNPTALTIGFARRFASYKRADLIFHDAARLRRLLADPWRPIQLVFAGKAHPADESGKEVLKRVYAYTRDSEFEGRVAFLEDYDMHLAHRLVEGVDLWMNIPRVPLEASGTSGMKAALNGVPQLGTIDGWWEEGFTGLNGWTIPLPEPGAKYQSVGVSPSLTAAVVDPQVTTWYCGGQRFSNGQGALALVPTPEAKQHRG